MTTPLLQVRNLGQQYPVRRRWPHGPEWFEVLADVSFSLTAGRTLAVVGESGSGKSTLARLLAGVEKPHEGKIFLEGQEISSGTRGRYNDIRMIFQDPYASLNPRARIAAQLEEPLINRTRLNAPDREERIIEALRRVGLRREHGERFPHMFSGGQRQRIAIARALILYPKIIVADEPISSLDVSIQAQIINLLLDLQEAFGLSYVFISHDLGVVQHFSDEVLVIYHGRMMEYGSVAQIFDNPLHPYTQALLASSPAYRQQRGLSLAVPVAYEPGKAGKTSGCPFQPRCPKALLKCKSEMPPVTRHDQHLIACHLIDE